MVVRMPGSAWKPISHNFTSRKRATTRKLILHVAATHADSLYGWFSNPTANASSHMYVAYDGTIEQYLDLDVISWASKDGNSDSVSVETAGQGSGRWTSAQVSSLVRIASFMNSHYGVPLTLMPNSRPGVRGVGWHRLGIDPWRVSGGESWSSSRGKVCPGNDRIAQIPGIVRAASNGDGIIPVGSITPIGGNTRADNERIQKLLASHGYYKGVIDGVDGPMMKAAVKAFQKRHGLVQDGYFGPVSQAAWDKATRPKPKPKPKPKGQPDDYADLRIDGDFGPVTVKAVQILMRAIKTYTRAVDGDWGRYTKIAVQEWLKGLGFYDRAVDGDFGKQSVIALQNFLASKHRYPGAIDGDFGPMTVKAFQAYLNSQNGR